MLHVTSDLLKKKQKKQLTSQIKPLKYEKYVKKNTITQFHTHTF